MFNQIVTELKSDENVEKMLVNKYQQIVKQEETIHKDSFFPMSIKSASYRRSVGTLYDEKESLKKNFGSPLKGKLLPDNVLILKE